MARVLLGRLVSTVPVLLIVAAIVFLMLRSGLGDPAAVAVGEGASNAEVAAARSEFGLDRTALEQFSRWLGATLQGDLGQSFFSRTPVSQLLAARLEPTLSLAILTLCISTVAGVIFGILAAYRRRGLFDRALLALSTVGFSVPSFLIGYALVYVFALRLGWLPVQGYRPFEDGLWSWLRHLLLPALSLAPVYVSVIARMTRAGLLDALSEDYVRTARAKGATFLWALVRHALPNAAGPILSVVGVGVGLMMGGVVVIESVFNIPGLGRLMIDAVIAGDYPVVQGVVLTSALVYVAVNLMVDLAYAGLDPRARL
jgi:peptide/nickel transport system permease protein